MPWPKISLRDRRTQVRDDVAAHLPGADASVPNSVLRIVGDAQASLTHDNDLYLDALVEDVMPDTATGAFADRWADMLLPEGRLGASAATGTITITGSAGSSVPLGTQLSAVAYDDDGVLVTSLYVTQAGVTLAGPSIDVGVTALTPGAIANRDGGTLLAFVTVPPGIDGQAAVTDAGISGGAEVESDEDVRARYLDVFRNPPHGGNANDYVQWARSIAGVTRAWARQEMGIGTVTVRFMMDDVRADAQGIPTAGDAAVVATYIDGVRPVTVADFFCLPPVAQPMAVVIHDLVGDTPATRASIETELRAMLRARATPGGIIYGSWIGEAVSIATGEEHHGNTFVDVGPASLGHIVTLGSISYV